jgi:hypothetical protein
MIHPFKTVVINSFTAWQPVVYASNSTRNPAGEPGKRPTGQPILLLAAGSLALGCRLPGPVGLADRLAGLALAPPVHHQPRSPDPLRERSLPGSQHLSRIRESKGKSPCLPSH